MAKDLKTVVTDLVEKLEECKVETDIDEDLHCILDYHLQQSFLDAAYKLGTKDSYDKTFAIGIEATKLFFKNLSELAERL
jgi:hypothetical protein